MVVARCNRWKEAPDYSTFKHMLRSCLFFFFAVDQLSTRLLVCFLSFPGDQRVSRSCQRPVANIRVASVPVSSTQTARCSCSCVCGASRTQTVAAHAQGHGSGRRRARLACERSERAAVACSERRCTLHCFATYVTEAHTYSLTRAVRTATTELAFARLSLALASSTTAAAQQERQQQHKRKGSSMRRPARLCL